MADGGGWSDLPLDLFSLIFSQLSLPQFLRSAAVCVSWSAAVGDLSAQYDSCFKFRVQSPWLVFNDDNPSAVAFYALDEARKYTIPVPDPPINDRIFLGSAHGWIITMDVRLRVQLLNPITGAQIDLPRLFPSEHTHPIRDTAGRLIGFRMPSLLINEEEQVRRRGYSTYIVTHLCLEQHDLKAILSADPSLGDGYAVAVALIQYPSGKIFFTRSGDGKWFELYSPILIQSMVFHKGKLYMSTRSEVYFCDLDEAPIRHGEMPRFRVVDRALQRNELHYLFETPRGDLLSIWRERSGKRTKAISVKVYRVIDEEENEKPSRKRRLETTMDVVEFVTSLCRDRAAKYSGDLLREEAKDLGDSIVFLGGRNPLCLSPCDFPVHLKAATNSVYFTDDYDVLNYIPGDSEFDAYWRRMSKELDLQKLAPPVLADYLLPMFLERNWFREILNCPISINFSMDNRSFVRLYWQPPSTSVNY